MRVLFHTFDNDYNHLHAKIEYDDGEIYDCHYYAGAVPDNPIFVYLGNMLVSHLDDVFLPICRVLSPRREE